MKKTTKFGGVIRKRMELAPGDEVCMYGGKIFKLIKSTAKGYRFLRVDTNVCIVTLYYPIAGNNRLTFWVPYHTKKKLEDNNEIQKRMER